jgi:Tol biopolymer transport system component
MTVTRAVRNAALALAPVLALFAWFAAAGAPATASGSTADPSAPGAKAVREPVLKQIRLPHHYYYRELYLPQATSGPTSADWSPDGRRLVVSMQGSLWIHDLGTGETRQVTDGPGYDYQPDWSPDGRFIVYATYRDDAVDLHLLEVATSASRPLVHNGAVNVEPRFSPDGRRVAYVSTAYEGRFHIFVVDVAGATGEGGRGGAGDPVRLTEDHDSGLPRYYYSVYDHYLSPTWSPDGGDLIFVSNRGKIWGTGGFWRARAKPNAKLRLVHDEETNWKARPDWSPDGRRVAYASYAGRQWQQLWLMTEEGGDPLQLTYGEFDRTAPRWSPDGRHIVCVSNERTGSAETAGTHLEIVDVPGSAHPIDLGRRQPFAPRGTLRVTVSDALTRQPLAARVSVMGPDGRFFAPDDAWRYADEMFVRGRSRFEYGYFHARGKAELDLPPGRYQVEVSRGPEYSIGRDEVEVRAGRVAATGLGLTRLRDMTAAGYRSGDLHVHMNYGGTYRNDPRHLAFQAEAEGLNLIEDLVVNKEQRIPDIAAFSPRPDPASTKDILIVHGQEYHTSYWGHTALLGLRENLLLPGYSSYVNTPAASAWPHNAAVFDMAHAQGALTGYVHPFDARPDPFDEKEPLHYEMPADAALGKMDYFEVMGFSDHLITSEIWYRLLNCGFRIPAGAGTDAMANYASLRGPVGLVRVFVKTGPRFTHETFLAGLKAGRTFVTNAPLLDFGVARKAKTGGGAAGAWSGPGDELRLPAGDSNTIEAFVDVRSPVALDHVEVIVNGKVTATVPLKGDRRTARGTLTLPIATSGWMVLRAWADEPAWPVLDLYPFASTSPIYVKVGDAETRSAEDAAYFVQWVNRLRRAAAERRDWNNDSEKADVFSTLDQASAIFAARAGS